MADSFTHLHVHTEYSMLDGAARIGEVVAAAAAATASRPWGSPTTGTCTGSSTSTRSAGPRASSRSSAPSSTWPTRAATSARAAAAAWTTAAATPRAAPKLYYHLTALAETNEGYQNLIKLSSEAYLSGHCYKPRADFDLLAEHSEGADRHLGVPRWARAPGADARRHRGGAQGGRAAAGHLRARLVLHRDAGPRHPGAAPHQPDAPRAGRAPAGAAARHQRQPLRPPERLRRPRRAALRADRLADERPRSLQVPRRRALPEAGARDALPVRRDPRGVRQHALDRRAGRRHHRVRQAAAARASRCPRASRPTPSYLQHLTMEGARQRWGSGAQRRRSSSGSPTSSA